MATNQIASGLAYVNAYVLSSLSILSARRYTSATLAAAPCPSVCLSHAGILSKRLHGSTWFRHRGYASYPALYYMAIRVSPNIGILPSGTLSQTLDLEKFLHGTSTVASAINLVRPTTVVSLSHWTSSFVYNTWAWHSASRRFVCGNWDLCYHHCCFSNTDISKSYFSRRYTTDNALSSNNHAASICQSKYVYMTAFSTRLSRTYWSVFYTYIYIAVRC